ncbi:MAG: DNA repair protein RecN [Oscillospiraceae bacterium]
MLSLLHIENIAVIEQAEIRFDDGFNVLTGETGAGKSIVIDAIGAVLGERTSRDLIRTGARSARVEAVFSRLPALPWFAENGVGPDENGELLLQRELQPDGKNVCRVGGRLLTVAQLKALGQQLLNIHGQHEGQQLLDEERHLDYLDRFGGLEKLLADFQLGYSEVSSLRREISALQMDEAERERRIDSLNFQIAELERANLKVGEEETLLARRDLLRNAEKLIEAVQGAHYALSGDEDSQGAVSLIGDAEYALSGVRRVSEELDALTEKMKQLRLDADDLAEQVRDLRDSFDFSPGELDEVESRLDVIFRLRKKYGNSVEEMLDYLDRSKKELEQIQDSGDTLLHLEQKLDKAKKEAREKGERLSEQRKQAAAALQERIQTELAQLDMPKVRFAVQFSPKDCQDGMDATGLDQVRFLMSANVGEDLKPIARIASGGELARVMLALKSVLAENDDVSTLIFDEVDTGVSGRAARKVAEKMADIAASKQVLCVTHLPQIAAMADTHFSVEKGERDGRTFTRVERLTPERRREELARLTGGAEVTPIQLESAGQLLEEAQKYRNQHRR